jgi:hypothetical protein
VYRYPHSALYLLYFFRRAALRRGPLLADCSSPRGHRPPRVQINKFFIRRNIREQNMRKFLVFASVVAAFAATMTAETTDANAVTCVAGVYRAGCVGPRGAVVVAHPPVAACRYVIVNGVRVRRCV